jgi:hypothetical protein
MVIVAFSARAKEPVSEGRPCSDIDNFDDVINNHLFMVIEFYA